MARAPLHAGLIESRPVRAAAQIVDLVMISVLVVAVSLPVVTATPACAAALGAMRDRQRLGDTAVLRPFLRHLRGSLPLVVLTIPLLVVTLAAAATVRVLPLLDPEVLRLPVFVVVWAVSIVVWTVVTLALAVWAHYDVRVFEGVRLAGMLAFRSPGLGLAVGVVVTGCAVLVVIVPPIMIILVGPALFAVHRLAARAFEREDSAD